jgi:hypothetical protein
VTFQILCFCLILHEHSQLKLGQWDAYWIMARASKTNFMAELLTLLQG